MEIWKVVPGYSKYEVSDLGNIRHIKHKKLRKPHVINSNSYVRLTISIKNDQNERKHVNIARLIGMTFLEKTENATEIDHINRDSTDNRITNLRWVTRQENSLNRNFYRKKINLFYIEKIINLSKKGYSSREIFEII